MDREESVPLDGAWNMHALESLWLSRGVAALLATRGVALAPTSR